MLRHSRRMLSSMAGGIYATPPWADLAQVGLALAVIGGGYKYVETRIAQVAAESKEAIDQIRMDTATAIAMLEQDMKGGKVAPEGAVKDLLKPVGSVVVKGEQEQGKEEVKKVVVVIIPPAVALLALLVALITL